MEDDSHFSAVHWVVEERQPQPEPSFPDIHEAHMNDVQYLITPKYIPQTLAFSLKSKAYIQIPTRYLFLYV